VWVRKLNNFGRRKKIMEKRTLAQIEAEIAETKAALNDVH